MPKSSSAARQTWPASGTSQDVITWALQRVAFHLGKFGLCCTDHDLAGMETAVKGIRHIATRMEQFRRTRAKQWTAAAPANSTTEKKR